MQRFIMSLAFYPLFILGVFLLFSLIAELLNRVIKRLRISYFFPTFLTIIMVWFIILPFKSINFFLFEWFFVCLGYYSARGSKGFPKYLRNKAEIEPLYLLDQFSHTLAFKGKLSPYIVPINLLVVWIFTTVHSFFFWTNDFSVLTYLILAILSTIIGTSTGLLFKVRFSDKREPEFGFNNIFKSIQKILFIDNIFGKEIQSEEASNNIKKYKILGIAVILFSGEIMKAIIIFVIIILFFIANHSIFSTIGSINSLLSGFAFIRMNFTQDIDFLGWGITSSSFKVITGVAISRKQRWGRLFFIYFSLVVIFLNWYFSESTSILYLISVVISLITLFFLFLPGASNSFINTKLDGRKIQGALTFLIACFLLTFALLRLGSFFILINKRSFHGFVVILLFLIAGLTFVSLCNRLWGKKLFLHILGGIIAINGAALVLNSYYLNVRFFDNEYFLKDSSMVILGRFLIGILLLCLATLFISINYRNIRNSQKA